MASLRSSGLTAGRRVPSASGVLPRPQSLSRGQVQRGQQQQQQRQQRQPTCFAGAGGERESEGGRGVGRRELGLGLAVAAAAAVSLGSGVGAALAAARFDSKQLDELNKLFGEAIELSKLGGEESFAPADEAWTKIIEFSPETSAAWSNRGTFRLQRGKWADAMADMEQAIALEGGLESADGYLVNNYANALGANGKWDQALDIYKKSAAIGAANGESDLEEIADANYTLGLLQIGEEERALESVRGLLRKDPNFLDMRAAETAILWAMGRQADAEEAWDRLQQSDEAGLYPKQFAIIRVQGRWPPRATAALSAFITLSKKGNTVDYDGQVKTFEFK